jgi:hypothetical protein
MFTSSYEDKKSLSPSLVRDKKVITLCVMIKKNTLQFVIKFDQYIID